MTAPSLSRHQAATALRTASLWRWPLVVSLLATTPAFYAELLAVAPAAWSEAVYFAAAALLSGSVLHTAWSRRSAGPWKSPWRDLSRGHALDLTLIVGLLASAIGPASSTSGAALVLRLVVAFLTMARIFRAVRHWITRGGVAYIMGVAGAVLLACGAGFWWLEPRTPTLADGLWLAFTTAATVGYGDIVPSTPASRIFSVFVVMLGYGVLTLATAAIATTWIETEERRIEREILRDVRRQLGALHAEIAALRAEQKSTPRE